MVKRSYAKRSTIDFSPDDLEMVQTIMGDYSLATEAAAIRWALHTVAKATEIVVKSPTGDTVRYTREGQGA